MPASLGRSAKTYLGAPTEFFESRNLDEHVEVIKRYLDKSLRDPETIKLARKLVSGRFDTAVDPRTQRRVQVVDAWGNYYRAPPGPPCKARDAECEITKIWDFVVLNLRYTFDPQEVDTFSTVKESLESGGGDCDDATILFGALLKAIGFQVGARVISTTGAQWEHIYPLVGLPQERPKRWIALDVTVDGFRPGDEYKKYKAHQDYKL